MKLKDNALEQYREQLNRWVAAMAAGDNELAAVDAASPYEVNDVNLFTEGNINKRADILDLQLSFLAPAFEDLQALIDEYMATQPLAAFAAGADDATAFLHWLKAAYELSAEQSDYVACRLARYKVEDAARARRQDHVRFQERLSVAVRLAKQLKKNRRLLIHLNPARGWALLQSRAFLDEQTTLPGDVVFFAVGIEIRSAVLDEPLPTVLEALSHGPLALAQWARRADLGEPAEMIAVVCRLAEVGLLAFS